MPCVIFNFLKNPRPYNDNFFGFIFWILPFSDSPFNFTFWYISQTLKTRAIQQNQKEALLKSEKDQDEETLRDTLSDDDINQDDLNFQQYDTDCSGFIQKSDSNEFMNVV
ncbi:hypothetical protein PPERSA_08411 [Pseudocohnilembus persalinus]|uniref:EF-hand domain-containing protein n=1 Tax=Pseudocohnilembus persalinus TaxID=266149 RepID=A0A0V0R773_PSEPJ|nr:hypothetical protein PPERSA_08411 [Pseudocohnilembus persalinus]|eukprot:KRX10008.1 hypothetical protein PPERSA_08411 [Pseudocohnilembus persalinus]